jgi:probable addiction module antidote protein
MKAKSAPWEPFLMKDLKNPKHAQGYIQACLDEGIPLHVALRDVLKAQGFSAVARKTHIAVPNVIRAVRESSNPTYDTMQKLLQAVGLDLAVRPRQARAH